MTTIRDIRVGDRIVLSNGTTATVVAIHVGPEPRGRRRARSVEPPPLRKGWRRLDLEDRAPLIARGDDPVQKEPSP